MLDNHIYNLMAQIVQESKSLWRIKNEYKRDAEGCAMCHSLMADLERQKEDNLRRMEVILRDHLKPLEVPAGMASPFEP